MANKNKNFGCVDMKNEAQAKPMEEYDQRKGEFVDFVDIEMSLTVSPF